MLKVLCNYQWEKSNKPPKRNREVSKNLELLLKTAKICSSEERSQTIQAYRNSVDPEEKKRLKEEILKQHIRFVYKVASQFFPLVSHIPGAEEDLVQEGILGFFRALDLVNEKKSILLTYCKWWVANACSKWIKNNGLPYRVPQHWNMNFLRKKKNFQSINQESTDDKGNQKEPITLVSPFKGPEETFLEQETLHEKKALFRQVKSQFFSLQTKGTNTQERNWKIFIEYKAGKKSLQTLSKNYNISRQRILQIVYEVEKKIKKILLSIPQVHLKTKSHTKDLESSLPLEIQP